jgi:2',3'-cyclic-nucleotide 2'-phosphodiesterase/3'-nucleotidase
LGNGNIGETLKMANFPLLLANVYEKSSGERINFTKPYVIIEKQGVKVAY